MRLLFGIMLFILAVGISASSLQNSSSLIVSDAKNLTNQTNASINQTNITDQTNRSQQSNISGILNISEIETPMQAAFRSEPVSSLGNTSFPFGNGFGESAMETPTQAAFRSDPIA